MPDDAIPEPIVEEPESPPSSPTVRAINLIEYNVEVLSDASSTEDEEEPPEIEEIVGLDTVRSPRVSLTDLDGPESEKTWA
ncbi:hypothetical protein JDV02_001325 [Purpureocillium takamizusanense]|uniref:Uncharacterized protein n=1 Tax=Purpureocillium takamizusanense TaxID=2060973 RepID=A0A9Q8Q6I6_9HYPO|nr:uncharacterized protein JDV02_001325 [Purpureocillium takamizusanense]UNI14724.1 hypothetical protein JDV02_001325 [Purpureocillium takamizusanense]